MRTYVVTGSASGIGKATAELLRSRGERVIGVDQRDADVVVDLGTPDGRRTLVDEVAAATGGRVDGVIANAGLGARFADAESMVKVNYFGAVGTVSGLRPLLRRSEQPRAVVVGSAAMIQESDDTLVDACLSGDEQRALDRCGVGARLAYDSSKLAVARWVRRNAAEWAATDRILLNVVAPGLVQTPMTAPVFETPETTAEFLKRKPHPLGPGQPRDIASVLAWFTSTDNTYVTGQVLFADGGQESVRRDGAW